MGQIAHESHMLGINGFLENNRLDHVTKVMGYHPTYLDVFLRTQHFILRGDGPLPFDYRHFIAIMAAGRHQCKYLIELQKAEFREQGGEEEWLRTGLAGVPAKLQELSEINKILAHRPWLISHSHIQKLTKGSGGWSLAEVVHAIVLLAHFHSLASFVFACGVNEQVDRSHPVRPLPKPDTNDSKTGSFGGDSDTEGVGVERLVERMKSLSERREEDWSESELAKRFERVESGEPLPRPPTVPPLPSPYIDDPSFVYEDFAKRPDIPTFRVQDYSWEDQGYSLVNRLYNDVGTLLDDKFKTAYNLTYYTMGGRRDVDTSKFRRAIWNYIQCVYGIRHDDYDYGEVNQLLERSLKAFIKTACCFPERVTKADYDTVLREFKHSEKVHVNLMILEARAQAELLYALRAVMRYMT